MDDLTAIPLKPGLHSYNLNRRLHPPKPKHAGITRLRWLLFLCGVVCLGFYGYSLANQHIYQAYENWAFDQEIAGRTVTFNDWLRERTILGNYMKAPESNSAGAVKPAPLEPTPVEKPLAEGALVGRVLIPRLHLSAIVLQGVEAETLARGAGHVPSTAMPGQTGNFAVAAHRDTLFRPLRFIKKDDDVTFESTAGSFTYQVVSTEIVRPTDVQVLQPPPGGGKWMTLITCYPFYYVGSAPKRFIVQAKLISADPDSKMTASRASTNESPPSPIATAPQRPKTTRQSSLHEPRHVRGSSAFASRRRAGFHRAEHVKTQSASVETVTTTKPKKRSFLHRLLHIF